VSSPAIPPARGVHVPPRFTSFLGIFSLVSPTLAIAASSPLSGQIEHFFFFDSTSTYTLGASSSDDSSLHLDAAFKEGFLSSPFFFGFPTPRLLSFLLPIRRDIGPLSIQFFLVRERVTAGGRFPSRSEGQTKPVFLLPLSSLLWFWFVFFGLCHVWTAPLDLTG